MTDAMEYSEQTSGCFLILSTQKREIDASTARMESSKMSRKRDSAYFEARLRKEFPAIYADLRAGKIKSVRQAAGLAGLIHLPGRLDALKRDWKLSSGQQRSEFLKWVKSSGIGLKPKSSGTVVDASGRLTPPAVAFIEDWMKRKNLSAGRIMKQMGYRNFDYRLAEALKGRKPLHPSVSTSLQGWMTKHGF